MQFSANLGYLWLELPLPDAIRAAKTAGFAAVEFHAPYEVPVDDVNAALTETGLPLLSLNTRRGNGALGFAAVPDHQPQARDAIDEALNYALATGASAVHVLAGNASGPDAHATFASNLRYALERSAKANVMLLIEPLNRHDAPEYFLRTTDQACSIIEEIGSDRLKLMFDCYHVARTEGDVTTRLADLLPMIGHIQFAGVPRRGPPLQGELDYTHVFGALRELGWKRPLGAEYNVDGSTDASLGWMSKLS